MDTIFKIIVGICVAPFVVFFCIKFGTIGYYKAKQYIEEEEEKQ